MNFCLFLPETIVSIAAMALLLLTLAKQDSISKILHPFMLTLGFVILAACVSCARLEGDLFYSTYKIDLLSQGFKCVLALAFLLTVLFSQKTISIAENRRLEYYFFLLTALLGMMMIPSSSDILTLYLSLELSAYSLYLLSALRQDKKVPEASVKYLIFGAATSGVFLWGLSLIAGLAQSTSLIEISKNIPSLAVQPAFGLGLVLVSFSFLFKLSSFPVHFWAPDVYESSSTCVTNFIATASKAAAVSVLIRVLMWVEVSDAFVTILGILAFISMTLGNCVALIQKDIKRLLAYSSIAQAGYILVGLLAGSPEGYSSSFFYAFAYVVMNSAAFLVVILVANSLGQDNPQTGDLDGLAERSPFLALILLLSLLSLAGIPPLVGFTGKWILFSAAMDKGHWFLVLWGVLNSVVSLFYYLTLVKHAYLEKPKISNPLHVPIPIKITGLLLFLALVGLGVFPNFVITFAQQAVAAGRL
jgi:NADH-quinone oxidoreductase subunit N